jgi:hypothetical protein
MADFGRYFNNLIESGPWGDRALARTERQNQLDALGTQLQLRNLQTALNNPQLSQEQKLQQLLKVKTQMDLANLGLEQQRGSSLIGLRGQQVVQDTAAQTALRNVDATNLKGLEAQRTGQALKILGSVQGQEQRLREGDLAAMERAFRYASSENSANRDLQQQQLAQARTQGLINSILGTALAAGGLLLG